jgi:hypothetical protein
MGHMFLHQKLQYNIGKLKEVYFIIHCICPKNKKDVDTKFKGEFYLDLFNFNILFDIIDKDLLLLIILLLPNYKLL